MSTTASPRDIANRQLIAYNAHDLDAFMDLFAPEAVIIDLPSGAVLANGAETIRTLYTKRFGDNPALHCEVFSRTELGDFAIDREEVTGLPDGPLQVIAIYEVREGLIRSVRFIRQSGPRPG